MMMRFAFVFSLLPMLVFGDGLPSLVEIHQPYRGAVVKAVDTSTLKGKVMCGYQGWFTAEGDGSSFPWTHWTTNRKLPTAENIRVEMWPDMTELSESERFATGFKLPTGQAAEVFSSLRAETVDRHFGWMREHGIDGVFVQRFASEISGHRLIERSLVLSHCRAAANHHGRSYAVMYDLSGLKSGQMGKVKADWQALRRDMQVGHDSAYQQHEGRPLVAVWGIGFGDDRAYSLDECRDLLDYLRADGCAIMAGVPTGWLRLDRDAAPDPKLHELLAKVDVISPWTVGRYRTDVEVQRHGEKVLRPDMAWCTGRGIDYMPVVFPGFSWHNMNREAPYDAIPRRGGQFLWSQCQSAVGAGAQMIYVAMFDEVDEGTAIFKCSLQPPSAGEVRFLAEPELPSDHYLRLTGAAGRMLRSGAAQPFPK
jgi:hypothetical protein